MYAERVKDTRQSTVMSLNTDTRTRYVNPWAKLHNILAL
jgi:hypothetical protein